MWYLSSLSILEVFKYCQAGICYKTDSIVFWDFQLGAIRTLAKDDGPSYFLSIIEIGKYKKLSYRRGSAVRRLLRRSRPLMPTDFSTNRKPVGDLLVNRPTHNLAPFARRRAVLIKVSLWTEGCLTLTNSFSEISLNIAANHILRKLDSLDYILLQTLLVYVHYLTTTYTHTYIHTYTLT